MTHEEVGEKVDAEIQPRNECGYRGPPSGGPDRKKGHRVTIKIEQIPVWSILVGPSDGTVECFYDHLTQEHNTDVH